jgi:hypothetical protein
MRESLIVSKRAVVAYDYPAPDACADCCGAGRSTRCPAASCFRSRSPIVAAVGDEPTGFCRGHPARRPHPTWMVASLAAISLTSGGTQSKGGFLKEDPRR